MTTIEPRYDLDALTNLLVEAITNQRADERAAWVLLLLERLDAAVQQRDGQVATNDLLRPIAWFVNERWTTGKW